MLEKMRYVSTMLVTLSGTPDGKMHTHAHEITHAHVFVMGKNYQDRKEMNFTSDNHVHKFSEFLLIYHCPIDQKQSQYENCINSYEYPVNLL